MRLLGTLILLTGLVAQVSNVRAADPVVFRYQARPGEKLYYHMTALMKQEQMLAGMKLQSYTQTAESVQREWLPAEEGELKLRSTTLHTLADMSFGPLGDYRYDSMSKTNDSGSTLGSALTPLYDAISGAVVEVSMSPTGRIKQVSGLVEAVQQAIGNNPIAVQFGSGVSTKDGARLQWQEFYVLLPEDAVTPGESWDVPLELELPQIGKVKGSTKVTYVGIDQVTGLHEFETTSEVTVDIAIKMNGADVTGTMKMSASDGMILFDNNLGQVVELQKSATIDGDLVASVGGMNITISQSQTQKYSAKLTERPAELKALQKPE